jgi:hypothetical protein
MVTGMETPRLVASISRNPSLWALAPDFRLILPSIYR